ncbi:MAG: hypothetical protein ABFS86_18090 [Planctomycetota bacterium]
MAISDWVRDRTTPHRAVERLVRRRWGEVQRGEFELCLALRRLYLDNVHRHAGYARFADYADQEFGIPGKLADLFCFLGRHLERLPMTREALERGDLTYTKAREFVKIATERNEEEWIDFALGHTNRDLERQSERVRRGTDEDVTRVTSRLTPAQVQATRAAREKMMKIVGESIPKDQLLPALAKKFVENTALFEPVAEDQAPEVDPTGRDAAKAGPYLSINLCPQCAHTWVPAPGENLTVPFEQWVEALGNGAEVHNLVADYLCDCEDVKHRRDRCPRAKESAAGAGATEAGAAGSGAAGNGAAENETAGNGAADNGASERPVEAAPAASRYIPVEVRRHVEARDGHRCRRPGCSNPVPLEQSHLKPFRDGTPATPEFLAQHCATCNDLIESGRLRVEGRAPLERYYLTREGGAGEGGDGQFVGWGFDPSPHIGERARMALADAGDGREVG